MIQTLRLAAVVAMLFTLAGFLAFSQPVITVCPSGCDYTSIQAAIAAAPNGSTIQIKASMYQENLAISKPISLMGEGLDMTTLTGGITISDTEAVSVTGLTIIGQGIQVQSSSMVVFLNNAVVQSTRDGLSLVNSATVTVWGNTISGNSGSGMVANHANVLATANTLSKNAGDGVSLAGNSWADLRDNEIDSNGGCALRADSTSQLSGKGNIGQSNGSGNTCGNAPTNIITYRLMNLLGNAAHTNSNSGSWTVGYQFTPNQDIAITAFRSYWGVKTSLLTAAGGLLFSALTNTPEKVWTDVPIPPQCLHAGQEYVIAAYTNGGNYYWISGPALLNSTVGAVHIGDRVEINGDAFPTYAYTINLYMVDFEYRLGC
jgi:parallel beta-helix repeat protein